MIPPHATPGIASLSKHVCTIQADFCGNRYRKE